MPTTFSVSQNPPKEKSTTYINPKAKTCLHLSNAGFSLMVLMPFSTTSSAGAVINLDKLSCRELIIFAASCSFLANSASAGDVIAFLALLAAISP